MNSKLIFYVLIYWISNVECLINNTSRLHDFPLIKDGQPCVKGKMYRMACNTCHCADNNALYCTKMACLEEDDVLRLKNIQQHSLRTQTSKDEHKKIKNGNFKSLRSENKADKMKKAKETLKNTKRGNGDKMILKDNLAAQRPVDLHKTLKKNSAKKLALNIKETKTKKDSLSSEKKKKLRKGNVRSEVSEDPVEILKKKEKYLPILPTGTCVPGKIYRKECSKCFCTDEGKATCGIASKTGCNDYPKPSEVESPNDVMPRISNEVYWKLPILAHSAAACIPGKMYMVTCNACLCLDNGNLLCEQLLCIDQEEMNFSKAKKWSGSVCKKGDTNLSTRCVRCQCVSDVTSCHPIPGCVEPNILKLHGDSKSRMSLDTKKEKCEPGTVYRVDCNFCYCQPNRMLRCTRKSCLNFRQSLMLKKQRSYLEKHGL